MLEWATDQRQHPVVILIPGNGVTDRATKTDYNSYKYVVEQKGERIAIIALGDFYQRGEELVREIKKQFNITPTLINPRFASSVDKECLDDLKKDHKLIITLEDGIVSGGFGEKIASYLGTSGLLVKNYGLDKKFYDRYNPAELLTELKMNTDQIIEEIKKYI